MIITEKQKTILSQYGIKEDGDINDVLLLLDEKITEIGFDKDYSLNEIGKQLQKTYDEIFFQNK